MKNLKQGWFLRVASKLGMAVMMVLAIGLFYKCGSVKHVPAVPEKPAAPIVVKTTVSPDVMAEGKTLYTANCQRCHRLYASTAYNANKWKDILVSMQRKAKITDAQRETIYQYLAANSKK